MILRLATAVVNQTPLDWRGNLQRLHAVLRDAKACEAHILCLPELCLSGYGCEDAFHSPATFKESWRVLEELLPSTTSMVVNFGLPVWYQGGVYNVALLVADGRPVVAIPKQHLAGDGIHYEPRWFKAWPSGVQTTWPSPLGPLPIGDLTLDLREGEDYLRLGFEICEDAWVAARPGGRLAGRAVDVILNPSASHFAFDKQQIRERFVVEGSRAFSVAYLYANLNGNEAGRAIYDGGAMVANNGKILARGPRFSLRDHELTYADVDIMKSRVTRARTASFQPHLTHPQTDAVSIPFAFHRRPTPTVPRTFASSWERGSYLKEEEFARAVSLGLLDYLRKSSSHGFVLSLSGGVDSAACAVLVFYMFYRLKSELSPEELAHKFSYWPQYSHTMDALLTTIYQASSHSSTTTRDAARDLAETIGARHHFIAIHELVSQYQALAEKALGRTLSWETDDLALQNIQARVRAPGPWLMANLYGALLLATSNRSEAAVGYATMDGDTAGGLAPLAGIDKTFLRHWLRWMETIGPVGFHPLPALHAITEQAPTAELRPRGSDQTDESDLMPYEVLDRIGHLAISEKLDPLACYERLAYDFPQSLPCDRHRWVDRFFRLFAHNQWKRERFAPSFHLDDQSLDPKTWLRFPILNGGYTHELAQLSQIIEKLNIEGKV